MAITLNGIWVENFKSYEAGQWVDLADMNVLMGANSSGKSTALQTLLLLKQTMECNSHDIDLLLSGKFVSLGEFKDVVNDSKNMTACLGVSLGLENELDSDDECNSIIWKFLPGAYGNADLPEIEFHINGDLIRMVKENGHMYCTEINGQRTQFLIDMYNLKLGDVYIEYDVKLNYIFADFLNEMMQFLAQTKKIPSIKKQEMVTLHGIDEFVLWVTKNIPAINKKSLLDEQTRTLSDTIINLIDDFAAVQFEKYENYDIYLDVMRGSFLPIMLYPLIQDNQLKSEVEKLVTRYRNILEEYKKGTKDDSDRAYSRLPRSDWFFKGDVKESEESSIDKLNRAFYIYRSFLKDILEKIFYVGPIREKPQGLYNIGFESVPKYVGPTGAFFASVLLHENKEKNYLFPNNETEECDLLEALDAWALHLNIASDIQVEQRNSFGFSVTVENIQNKKSDIMNVGIGTSQVLPVLVTGLLSEENETLIFEQPELHLHPYSQSRLADFFVALAKNGRRVIVETHSEYMLLRLRYHVLTEHISENCMVINFFQNTDGTRVKKGVLGAYGNLEYPDDFKDETQELINELMNAAMMKGKRDEKKLTD